MKNFINKLPESLKWVPHNMLAHPLSEIFYILSCLYGSVRFRKIGDHIHDITLPDHTPGEGRG